MIKLTWTEHLGKNGDLSCFIFGRYRFRISNPRSVILTEDSRGFLQSLQTERHGRVINIPLLYSEDPGFKSRLGDRLSWLRLFVFSSTPPGKCRDSIFLSKLLTASLSKPRKNKISPFRQILESYLKTSHVTSFHVTSHSSFKIVPVLLFNI
jgi:hypothetical protein